MSDRWERERDWIDRLPKIELHLHLEGAIPYEILWELIQKYGGEPGIESVADLRGRMQFKDFPHFLQTWGWKNGFLRECDDFTLIAEAVARDLARQNVRYAEVFYSPRDFAQHGLRVSELTQAIRTGLDRVDEIRVALVADFVRDFGPEQATETLSELAELQDPGVIGVGIGGSEHKFPPEVFADVYERARDLGFRTSAHAGEAAGPESVWGAIRSLQVDRIGHGTRAAEDAELVEYLVDQQIGVELCPLSNVRTGVTASIDQHPARRFLDAGMLVSINTDDPKMFHNTLTDEFLALRQSQGISRDGIRRFLLNAVESSWMSTEDKATLRSEMENDVAWNEEPERESQ